MDKNSNIRIADIARLAGVSVGTVDRVIHQRGKVSKKNLEKIEAVLTQVDYQPNLLARSLAAKKQYRVLALIPEFSAGEYWEAVSEGIDAAEKEMRPYNVTVSKHFFNQYDNASFDKLTNKLSLENIDAVLLATLFSASVSRFSNKLDEEKIPYVYVDSNIEQQNQLAYFGTDSYVSGEIAAKLLTEKMLPDTDILIAKMIHKSENDSHQVNNRRKGFLNFLEQDNFRGDTHLVELKLDDDTYNYSKLDEVFANNNIKGIVIFNSTCYILGDYLKKRNKKDICLIGYDLIRKNVELLSEGFITTLLAQRPESQGYQAIKSISNYLLLKQLPEKINLMPIDILIKENIKYY